MKKYGFGVDIGGTTCKIGLFDMSGKMLEKWKIPTNTSDAGASILDDVACTILTKIEEKAISLDDVQGVGLGVPGPVGKDGMVYKCVNLGWDVFNVEDTLSRKTGLYVKAGNDANVATLGEMWQGGAKGYQNVVMITLGTGVGGGIIIDGKIVSGSHGAGGEIGHIEMNEHESAMCGCGNKGCLEQYASATGIVLMAKEKLNNEMWDTQLRQHSNINAKNIFDAAKTHDQVAIELVDEFTTILSRAMAHIAVVVDPEIFVIGGGVSKAGDILLEGLKRKYQERAFHACKETSIVLAQLGNDAGMYGCVRLLF